METETEEKMKKQKIEISIIITKKVETEEKMENPKVEEATEKVDYHSPFYYPLMAIWRTLIVLLAGVVTYLFMKHMITSFKHSGRRSYWTLAGCIGYTTILVPIAGWLIWCILLDCRDAYAALKKWWMIEETPLTSTLAQKEPPLADMV